MAVAAVISAVRRSPGPRLPGDCSDDQLARRVAAGNEAAFEAIYDRYAPGLLAFCRQLLSSRDEAEDAVQQSFARAYQALRSGPGPDCLKQWLYAIARNRCLTLLAARRVLIDLDGVRGAVPPVEDCYAEVQRRADVGDLVDDLRRLPDDQRVALVLFELGGHSQHDIGEVLGVAPARVKALVFQAREGLARAREARAGTCREVLEELAVLRGPAPRRGPLADHLARCDACSAFASEVGRQRRALSVIMLPAVPPLALKAKVLGTALSGGGAAAAVGSAGGTGGVGGVGIIVTATATATATASGGAAAGGGALAVAGAGGAGTLGAAATGTAGLAAAGGLATMGAGGVAAGLAVKGVVAKILTAVVVAGSATAVTVAPGTHPAGPVAPASIAPIAADRPAPRPAGPADAPHVGTLPSSTPGPADQSPTPAPVAPPVPAVTAPAQATMAAPAAASTPAPAPDPAPSPASPAASTAPDPGGAPADPAPAAPADPAPADTGGAGPAPAATTTTADSGGAQPVDPTTMDAAAAGAAQPVAAAQ